MDKTKQAVAVFDKLAEGYQEKFMDVSLYNEALNTFCKHLAVADARVLDLACGPGNVAKYLLDKQPQLHILGTDLSPRMLELARINNPTAEFQLMDSRKLSELNKNFDGILCSFLLPYLSKEEALQLIRDMSTILTANGVLYISTMEDDNTKSRPQKGSSGDEVFMNYHEAGYLTKALEEHHFQIIDLQRKHYSYQDIPTTDLLMVAKKR